MNIYFIIAAMALATYLPRLLPVIFIHRIRLPKRLKKILVMIPYAALGTLIFPGIMSVDEKFPAIGVLGGLAAILISYRRFNVIFTVTGSILVVYFLKLILGAL